MKKLGKLAVAVLAVLMLASLAACSEGGNTTTPAAEVGPGAIGTAIYATPAHGSCVTEATVVVDGAGKPIKVVFDDIFPASNVYSNKTLMKEGFTDYVEIGEKKTFYFKYLHIGDKYFEVNDNGLYMEMGSAAGKLTDDLMTYYKTEAGTKWYYESFKAGKLFVCGVDNEKGTEVGGVKLADTYKFNTTNGSMRKRYSKYWSAHSGSGISQVTGLGFNGNMEVFEEYILAYGFDAFEGKEAADVIKLTDGYNVIGGVATSATLGADSVKYMSTAYQAYKNAIAQLKAK